MTARRHICPTPCPRTHALVFSLVIGIHVWAIQPVYVQSQSPAPEITVPNLALVDMPVDVTIEYTASSATALEYRFTLSDGRPSGWTTSPDTTFTFPVAGVFVVRGAVRAADGLVLGAASDSIRVFDNTVLSFGTVLKPPGGHTGSQVSRFPLWLLLLAILIFEVILITIEAGSEIRARALPPRVSVRPHAAPASARMSDGGSGRPLKFELTFVTHDGADTVPVRVVRNEIDGYVIERSTPAEIARGSSTPSTVQEKHA